MIELLAHIALAVGFFALGYTVRKAQEPDPHPLHTLEPPAQAVKVVGRRGGRELPDVEVRALRPKL